MNNTLGEHIKEFRIEHDLSLRDFAKMADISHTHIDSIEKGLDFRTGKPVRITNETIQKLAKALDEDESFLFQLSIGKPPSEHTSMIGNRLRILRKERDYTQEEMAIKIGITKSAYGYYEQDKTVPDAYTLERLADIFHVSTDYLLGKTDLRNYSDYKPTITDKDERNLQCELERMMDDIDNRKSGPAAYGGELDLDDYDRELLKGSLEQVLRIIKLKNKETYTPHKYRKQTDN